LTKGVFDIDSIQLISLVKKMRDEKKFLNGDEIDGPPQMFIGAAENPFAEPYEWRVYRLAKKVEAGADFIQTQCIYDMKMFREWIKQANDMGLTEKVHILAGITPLKSGGMARYMAKNVSGIIIPEEVINRIVQAKKAAEEGINFCVEQIEELKEMKGVHGIHLMAIEWEHKVPEIAERAKLLPRPSV
jgi:methylenetetrahydrofolate reductase (NADPH)